MSEDTDANAQRRIRLANILRRHGVPEGYIDNAVTEIMKIVDTAKERRHGRQ